jgi:hypothetical protein
MVVHLNYPPLGLKGSFVLKLYDRRFATGLRRDIGASPWNLDIEDEYLRFVNDGKSSDEDWVAEEREDWNKAQYETYLQYSCHKIYKVETKVYDKVQDI